MGRLAMSTICCVQCGLVYTRAAFFELATVRTLEAAELGHHVSGWPSHRRIEVRACKSCKRPIARTASEALTPRGATAT